MKKSSTITINKVNEKTKANLKVRIISAIVALAILVPVLILGDWALFVFMLFALAVALLEILKCANKKYPIWAYIIMFIMCSLIMCWPLIRNLFILGFKGNISTLNWHIYNGFDNLVVSLLLFVVALFALFFVVMCTENFTVRDVCYLLTMSFMISLGFQSVIYIRSIPMIGQTADPNLGFYNITNTFESMTPIVYLLIATMMTDTGAYFIGILFGHRKVNERISPNKTWAGFFGGMIVSTIFSFAFGITLAACKKPMLAIFDLDHWYNILILSMLIPPFATLGDFVFSAIKRHYGIKDFGNIMPGHGGILDRSDSYIFSALVMALFISIAIWASNGFTTSILI